MLFDPAANLTGKGKTRPPGLGLHVIAGDVAVGQVCCDPATFADVTTLVAVDGLGPAGAAPVSAPARALLGLVWPSTAAQARLLWGGRVAARLQRWATAPNLDDLLPLLVADVIGVPAAVLHEIRARCGAVARSCVDPVARAAVPMAVLHAATAAVVHDRATRSPEPGRPDTVLDELLFWRGLGHERVSLGEIAALVSALTASAWDAACRLLPRLAEGDSVESAMRGGPRTIGWLRVTTQTVLLDGAEIPAGTRCWLEVAATEPRDRPVRPSLHTLRWLAPDTPDGAGADFARLVGDAVLKVSARPERDRLPWRHLPVSAKAKSA